MTKIIICITRSLVAILVSFFAFSCNSIEFKKGNGNVVTENRDITEAFDAIKVSTGITLEISQGTTQSLQVETDENLQENIKTEVRNGVLKIYADKNIKSSKSKKVKIQIVNISSLISSSGADIKGKTTLKSQNLALKSSSGSDIEIDVEVEMLSANASSGSEIEITGKAMVFEASSSSGSEIDAKELMTNDVLAKASSGSNIKVHPILNLDAKASSGSSIYYYKTPQTIHMKKTSGGSIKNK